MSSARTLQLSTPSDLEIVIIRDFDAPQQLVWDAHTKCSLLKKWLFGPDGWSLDVCQMDLRVGGKYRWVWRHASKKEMGLSGVFREIVEPARLVCTEKFDDPWYPGEALNSYTFEEAGGKTTMTLLLRYESREARDMALKSGMDTGMEMGYARLDVIFAEAARAE
jgi:uncharacterized protein YndB with AHSA1/START domain